MTNFRCVTVEGAECGFYGVCLAASYAGMELGKTAVNLLSSRPDYDDDISAFL
ncbi:hypothetical protein [Sphaerospermopsis sp. LEGE 08334]|jgi:hypothetical protein|uniref:hypothetical protein n=1 Tax=Sphaerospermopsis sp. LEGE 08334 TaxID=1828651 RepID=UPI0018804855|nr:hypothetical protein [Sphaerospermopsis sp. LEGE 08334]MBE9057981.1 hypothetical protein [Sphaerospermopsis sp. LEGE 08334]